MHITLIDLNQTLVDAWKLAFEGSDVAVVEGDLTALEVDAIVSPANSFGFMDGGVDYAISVRLGWELQERLQALIKTLPEGELLIGKALVLDTGDATIPFLIAAPTMRIPTNFGIPGSVNAYLAMKATLIAAKADERIQSIAIPGLCTGCGRMKPEIAAHQMLQAYREIMLGARMDFKNFWEAQKYHLGLNPEGMIWTH